MTRADVIPVSRPCTHCGYDLRGVPNDGYTVLCPECGQGQSISQSAGSLRAPRYRNLLCLFVGPWIGFALLANLVILPLTRSPIHNFATIYACFFVALAATVCTGWAMWRMLRARRPRRLPGEKRVVLTFILVTVIGYLYFAGLALSE